MKNLLTQDHALESAGSAWLASSILLARLAWAELAHRGGLSDQKIKKDTFVRVEKLSFCESPV